MTDTPNGHARGGTKSGVEQGSVVAGVSHIPRSLLYSAAHGDLAVPMWADYESLMPRLLRRDDQEERGPAVAGRRYLAEAYGTSTDAVDEARGQLGAVVPGGVYLVWSSPRGRQRTVQHMARRRPQETHEPYVPVPAWTRTLIWAGRRRPAGRISAGAWRQFAAILDRSTRDSHEPQPIETTVKRLGAALGLSDKVGRRRLHELETAGLVEVIERVGGWLSVRPVVDPDEAQDLAETHAARGRTVAAPLPDTPTHPSQIRPLTPPRYAHSPLPDTPTPCTQPPTTHPPKTQPTTPAVGELPVVDDARAAAHAAEPQDPPSSSNPAPPQPAETARLYRLIPERLRALVPEHGSRRVLHAIADELTHRTTGELAERITRQGQAWAYVIEDVKDATAVAITIVRRGYTCPDIRCEDHTRIDTDQPCTHCATLTSPHKPAQAPDEQSPQPHGERPSQAPQAPYRAPQGRPLDDAAYRQRAAEARAGLAHAAARASQSRQSAGPQ